MNMTRWQYTSKTLTHGESWYEELRAIGQVGWEAWHMENINGIRTIYLKRPETDDREKITQ